MTDHMRDDTLTGLDLIRARLLANRPNADVAYAVAFAGGGIALFGGGFVLAEHTGAYIAAGAKGGVGLMGALAGQLLVLGLVFAATALILHGDRRGYPLTGAAGVVAVGFALLPALAAGRGWLTIVLLLVITLVLDALLSAAVFLVAFFGGLGHQPDLENTPARDHD